MNGSDAADDEPYDVEWAAGALRNLEKLPEKVAAAVIEFVYGALANDPRRVGRRLHLELEGSQSARRGPYRVIYRVDDDERVLTVTAVAHRRDVYARRRGRSGDEV